MKFSPVSFGSTPSKSDPLCCLRISKHGLYYTDAMFWLLFLLLVTLAFQETATWVYPSDQRGRVILYWISASVVFVIAVVVNVVYGRIAARHDHLSRGSKTDSDTEGDTLYVNQSRTSATGSTHGYSTSVGDQYRFDDAAFEHSKSVIDNAIGFAGVSTVGEPTQSTYTEIDNLSTGVSISGSVASKHAPLQLTAYSGLPNSSISQKTNTNRSGKHYDASSSSAQHPKNRGIVPPSLV